MTRTPAEMTAEWDAWVRHGQRHRYDLFPDPPAMRATYHPWLPPLGRYDRPDIKVGLIGRLRRAGCTPAACSAPLVRM
jgi:hypothetical protein